ncbi:cAMP-specific 3',5'-cyclic phosphodiesterase 4D [Cladochytrium tenue]|nr:cAMP-specific 3',5'-cyclic phosphodiesterase 4D [Cladochytrium tenue]
MPRAGAGPAIPGPMANQPRRRSHARNYDSLLRTVGGPGGGGSSSTEGGGTAGGGSAAGARLTSIVSIDNGSAPDGGLGLGVASPAMDRSWQKSDSGAGSVMASAPLPSSPVLGRRGTARSGASERAPPGSSAAISDSGGGANGWAPMITVALASAKGRSDPGSAVQLQTGATVVSEPGVIGNGGPAAAAAREAALVEWDSYEWGGVFELAVATGGRPLSALWWHLLSVAPSPTAAGFGGGSEHGGVAKTIAQQLGLDVERAWRFAVEIERGYHADLPYHNSTHAADVLHCMAVFSRMPAVTRAIQPQPPSPAPSPLLSLGTPASAPSATATPLDVLAMYVAAAIHDYDHPGLNNNFLMTTGDPKAVLYNDRSILENHHLASGFAVLSRPEFNFLSHLSSSEYKPFRETVIEMVLATDLSQHFSLISVFKTKLAQNTFNPAESREDRILLQRMLMKIADVSNPAKPWPIYARWCARVLEEFARQGDRERALGLPISPYMDRTSLNVPSSQIGFLDFVIAPLFEAYDRVNLKNAGVVNLVDVVSPEQFAASTGVEPLRLPGDEDTVSVAVETASTAGAAGQSASSASQTRARIGGGWASGSLRQLAPATPQVSLTAPTGGGGGGGGMWASRFALPRGDNTDSTHGR